MNYSQYSVEDFANDPLFVQWVKSHDPKLDLFWQAWLDQHPDKRLAVEQARDMVAFLSFASFEPSAREMREVKAGIKRQVLAGGGSFGTGPKKRGKIFRLHPLKEKVRQLRSLSFLPVVLVGVLLVGAALSLLLPLQLPMTAYTTEFGQVKKLQLPDGSRVVLNANSTIRFAQNWEQTHRREVWIVGEAFFEVVKKPDWRHRNFTVHTEKSRVEVLGTSFNVHNRRGAVQVMLQSGKVKLYPDDSRRNAVDMSPRDLVEVDGHTQVVRRKVVEPGEYTAWVQDKLIFDDTPISQIAQLLEDTYGVAVVFSGPSFSQMRFTGAVPNNRLDLFLTVLEESLGVSISRSGQTLIFKLP